MRVISLLPAATEIVSALGLTNSLMAVTHECDYPEEVREIPRATFSSIPAGAPGFVDAAVRDAAALGTSLFTLDADFITQLAPDVIITQALCDVCAVSETDVRRIAKQITVTPSIVTLSGTSIEGVLNDITTIAATLEVLDRGKVFVKELRERLDRVRTSTASNSHSRVRTAVIEWTDPIYAAGHWVPEMVEIAGGIDVLAKPGEHSRIVSMQEIMDAQPEVLFIAPCGYDLERARIEARELLEREEWKWARGIPVHPLDANGLVSRPGPRIVEGVETMARLLNH